jgi:alpha-galactosidase/6-phospho-beta-glucosidase family protein
MTAIIQVDQAPVSEKKTRRRLLSVDAPAGVQQLAVEAEVHASQELAMQALLIDPLVNRAAAAEFRILDFRL